MKGNITMNLKKNWDVWRWSGLVWLRIVAGGEHVRLRKLIVEFEIRRKIS